MGTSGHGKQNLSETIARIKERVSLREVMEADGAVFRRAGTSFVTCCTIHEERTPSCHVHESDPGDWFRCFGCGAGGDLISYMKVKHGMSPVQAVNALRGKAGIGTSDWVPPNREKRHVDNELPVLALDSAGLANWDIACASLYGNREEMRRIAEWRGFGIETVEWAARRGLMGRVIASSEWREAFVIERPCNSGMETERIGWHVRLAANTSGNPHGRAIWWYLPRKGLGSWPFVIWPDGGPIAVRHLFIAEGQWDALALVDLFGWHQKWPSEVGVVGVRGATSWKRLFGYSINIDTIAYLFGDADDAGSSWFIPKSKELSFSQVLECACRRVHSWRPNPSFGKDLNDVLRILSNGGKDILRAQIRASLQKRPSKKQKKITFYAWLRMKETREKYPDVFGFAKKMKERRPSTSRKIAWDRFFSRSEQSVIDSYKSAFAEWRAL